MLTPRFNFQITDDLQRQLGQAADIDRIAPKMLNGALPLLRKAIWEKVKADYSSPGRTARYVVKGGLAGIKYREYTQTGGLLKSVRMSRARKMKRGGYYANVYFKGQNGKGVPYNQIAAVMEYGSSKQAARPFLNQAVHDVSDEALNKMQEVFNKEAGVQ